MTSSRRGLVSCAAVALTAVIGDPWGRSLSSQEPVGATARCRDGSYSFSSTPCSNRGGISQVLGAGSYLVHSDSGAPLVARLTTDEARNHSGEAATVCGYVAAARHVTSIPGDPTFLDLDHAYPWRVFSIVIWGVDRSHFLRPPESAYQGLELCVTGRIDASGGAAYITVRSPRDLRIGT